MCSRIVVLYKRLNAFYCCNFCFSQSSAIKSNNVRNHKKDSQQNVDSIFFYSWKKNDEKKNTKRYIFIEKKLDVLLIWIQFINFRGFFYRNVECKAQVETSFETYNCHRHHLLRIFIDIFYL